MKAITKTKNRTKTKTTLVNGVLTAAQIEANAAKELALGADLELAATTGGGPCQRSYWRDVTYEGDVRPGPASEEWLQRVSTEDRAHLVGSLCASGFHAPAIDIDFGLVWRLASRERTELSFRMLINSREWLAVLGAMRELGWVAPDDYTTARRPALRTETLRSPTVIVRVPVRVTPSSTRGHFHLYIDSEITWPEYSRLLRAMERANILRGKFYVWALERGQTMLFRPGLKKSDLVKMEVALCRGVQLMRRNASHERR